MHKQRIRTILYNAIILLQEQGFTINEIKKELGISTLDYNYIIEIKKGD